MAFGSYIMPRYGYDMSPTERWDVVNFVRHVIEKRMTATSKEERASQVLSGATKKGGK